ncbi:hypothetical protein RHSIM_Rhsim04G0059700 [Rhododendron simsii]|uniref:SWIM-type domain-containing protein n=1 Tax=Rhododendron simsii TaxID=118357 RepID=A0A834HC89_RHOSS|nr:hypothetical protein RHSIM_Rhsim04G0059700 [Rhododendron simsii]
MVMASALYFDINVHFKGKVSRIKNVEPNCYSYIDLLDDVSEKVCLLLNSKTCQIELFVELSDVDGGLEIIDVERNEGAGGKRKNVQRDEGDDPFANWPSDSDGNGDYDNMLDVIEEDDSENSDEDCQYPLDAEENDSENTDGFSSYESDNEDGGQSSDDDGKEQKNYVDTSKFGKEFHVDGGDGEITLKEGLLFANVDKFREALKEYTIQKGYDITYKIRKYEGEHTCLASTIISEANSTWICKKMIGCLRTNPKMTLDAMQVEIQHKYGVEASLTQLYRARRKALDEIEGNHAMAYKLLPTYAHEVRKSNPGSLVKINVEKLTPTSNPMFQRFFIAFDAMIFGFKAGCRPFIGLDGCHLKGPYGGVLLATVALDANNGLFPIAIAIVEKEGRDSWEFFIDHLQTVIGAGTDAKPWTFMSDMQKSIDKVLGEFLPESSHRLCCRHLFANFKKVHPGMLLKKYFWEAARAYNQVEYQQAMERIKNISKEAHKWLSDVSVDQWARHAFDERVKNDHITNNLTESFNSWLGHLRHKPILSLLEGVRTKVMTRIQKRHAKASTWVGLVGPHVKKRLAKAQRQSRQCTLLFCGGDEYEIIEDGRTYELNMSTKACSCREWQIAGIPCRHAVAALTHKRANIEEGCDQSFMIDAYLKTHGGMIHPVRDQRMWEPIQGHQLDPPPLRRMPGRPRKNRRREADEEPAGTSQTKSICNEFGHNKRTCQRAPVKQKKSAMGASEVREQGQGVLATPTQASQCVTQAEVASQSVTQSQVVSQSFRGSHESVGSRGRGRTTARGNRARGRNGGSGSRGRGSGSRGRGRSAGPTANRGNRGGGRNRGRGRSVDPPRVSEYAQF